MLTCRQKPNFREHDRRAPTRRPGVRRLDALFVSCLNVSTRDRVHWLVCRQNPRGCTLSGYSTKVSPAEYRTTV